MIFSKWNALWSGLMLLLITCNSANGKMVDMTHRFNNRSLHYQGARDFELVAIHHGYEPDFGGLWIETNNILMFEHTGTHVDAPVHCWRTGIHVHEIPVTDLIGPAIVINVTEQALTDPDYTLTVKDIEEFEMTYGKIPDKSIVFLDTSGAKDYWNRPKYLGSTEVDKVSTYHFPGFSADSVEWLINKRDIAGIGNDRMSFDSAINTAGNFPVHKTLLSAGRFGIENANNVDKLPPVGATVFVMALPLENGSGSPARILAFWDTHLPLCASAGVPQGSFYTMLAILFVKLMSI